MKLNVYKTKTMIVSRSCTMHPQSPPLTIGRTVQKESHDLVILGVTFDSKMTFEKHLRSVSRAVSQRLGILSPGECSMIDRSLGDAMGVLSCPFLEYCSAVRFSAADTHLKLLGLIVSGTRFLAGGVFDCNNAHRRSVAVLCMLYKIRSNTMHPLALPGPYVPVLVTHGVLVALRYTYASPRCRTSQYHRTFVPLSVSLWNDLEDPKFEGVGPMSRANDFLLA